MGVIDQIHRLELDPAGRIVLVEYSGWEANPGSASYARRTWRIGRYTSIHLIQLRDPAEGEAQVVSLGFGPLGPSVADALRHTPDGGFEEEGCRRGRGLPELPVAHGVLNEASSWGRAVNAKQATRAGNQGRDPRPAPRHPPLPNLPVFQGVLGDNPSRSPAVDVDRVVRER
jgi:hypothetical protein